MNIQRMKEALKVIIEECGSTECQKCPMRSGCYSGMDEMFGDYAVEILDYAPSPECPYCREDDEPGTYYCIYGDGCEGEHSKGCVLEDDE